MSERERLALRLREIARPGEAGDMPRIVAHALRYGSEMLGDDQAFAEARRLLRAERKPNRITVIETRGPTPRPAEHPRRGDVLETIPPPDYWEALTGNPVEGGRGRCPLPGHPDHHPSAVIYPDPGRGWWCPVCNGGGSAIDLAAAITGIEPRGRGYLRLRQWVAERLLNPTATRKTAA